MNTQDQMSLMLVYPINSQTEACANCKYFIQHFMHDGWCFRPVYMGHCIYPRLKNKRPDDACGNFAAKK